MPVLAGQVLVLDDATTSLDPVEFMERRFQESAANVVHDLRDLADRVERVAKIQDPITAANLILNSVMNALPNLSLGRLFDYAHDLAVAMAESESPKP
jgi:predicted DNA repair protein MutK